MSDYFTDPIRSVLGRMRTGRLTPSRANADLRSALEHGLTTDDGRFRVALRKVSDRLPGSEAEALRQSATTHRHRGDWAMRKRQACRSTRDRYRPLCNGDFSVDDEMRYSSEMSGGLATIPPQVIVEDSESAMQAYGEIADREWADARRLSLEAYLADAAESKPAENASR